MTTQTSERIKNYNAFTRQKQQLAEAIKEGKLSSEEAKTAFQEYIYAEAPAVQKSFGETVEDIMRIQGLTKMWRGEEILDVPTASELTGLNSGIFHANMYKPDCTVDMALVISMCIGFKLGPALTQRLLQSAGLTFRFENPEHIAYIFLLEYCKDFTIEQCNEFLQSLGIKRTKQLGSYRRGKDGEQAEYKPRTKE